MTSTSNNRLPANVDLTIRKYRQRKAVLRAGVWWLSALAAGVLLLVASLTADRFFRLPVGARVAMTTVTLVAPALLLLIGCVRLLVRQSLEHAAGEVDAAVPGSRDLLRTSLNVATRDVSLLGSPFMLQSTLSDADSIASAAQRTPLFRWRNALIAVAVLLGAAVLAWVLLSMPMMKTPLLLKRFLHPGGNYPRPSMIEIAIGVDGSQDVQQGDDVTIRASLAGLVPPDTRAEILLVPEAGGPPTAVAMNPRPGGQFEATFQGVVAPIRFVVTAADGMSEQHTIAVKARPSVTAMTAKYTFPRYTLFPTRQEPVRREFKGVDGTVVRVDFETSLPVSQSKAIFADRQIPIRFDATGTKGNFSFTITKDTTFKIFLQAEAGTDNHNDAPYRIRMTPDSPPAASLLGLPENATFTRDSVLNLSYKGTDDFGVNEVYLRYRRSGGANSTKEYSLQNTSGTAKEVAADFALPLQDVTREDDIWVELELVMVDGKGQEGSAPVARIQVTSNTPERQLLELLEYTELFSQPVGTVAGGLESARDQLAILLETMSETDALTGSRQATFDKIKRGLSAATIPVVTDDQRFKFLTVSEYPYQLQRRAHDLFSRALAVPTAAAFADLQQAIEKSGAPQKELLTLKARLDAMVPGALALRRAMRDAVDETRLTLVELLASQYLTSNRETVKGAEAAALQGEKQEVRLRTLLAQFDQLKSLKEQDELLASFAVVRKASSSGPEARGKDLAAAVAAMLKVLRSGSLLRGGLGVSSEAYLRSCSWTEVFKQAAATGTVARANAAAAVWGRLGRCNPMLNPAEALLAAALQQASQSADNSRLSRALAATSSLEEWSLASDLYERSALLRRCLTQWDIESRTGRMAARPSSRDEAWLQLRELCRSLAGDCVAGRFAGMSGSIHANLQTLVAAQESFWPWDWREAEGAAWEKGRATAIKAATALTDELLPRVREGRAKAAALLPAMLMDVAVNLVSEKAIIAAEMPLLRADVELANSQPVSANNTILNGKTLGRRADPPRVNFTKLLSDRFTAYAIAMSAICDVRQAAWSDRPDAASMDELKVLAVLFESLSHLDEEVYDKTYALHLQQKLRVRSYPAYLEETGRYMSDLSGPIHRNETILRALAGGEVRKLAADGGVTGLPASLGKQVRYETQMNSLTQQLEFVEALRNAKSDAARRVMLLTASKDTKTPTAYWDRIYLACEALLQRTAPSASGVAGWAGVAPETLDSFAASVAQIRNMLPEVADGEETKLIVAALDDFSSIHSRVRSDKMPASAPARGELLDAYEEWRGQIRAALQITENRLTINAIKSRPRPRIATNRADLETIFGRLIQNEAKWIERNSAAARITASSRLQLLVAADSDPATGPDDLAFDFAREGIIRRRSVAVASQSSRGINIDGGEIDEQFLKMPKHLYMELVRNAKKPYPTQYKNFSIEYVQGLLKDAR